MNSPVSALDKKVVVVNSYNKDFKWVEEHNGVLKRGVAGKAEISFYYLDFKRLNKKDCDRRVAEAKAAIERDKPEVVVVTDDYALKSLGQFLVDRDIPVVFLGINGNARKYVDNVRKITGVFERPLVKRSIAYLKEIVGPGKFLVLMDDSLSSRVFVRESLNDQTTLDVSGAHADIELVRTFSDWKAKVKNALNAGYSCLVIGTYHIFRDEQGKHISSEEVIRWTSMHSPVPIFGLWDFSVGKGKAVGGYVLSGIDQGREALKMVKKILAGENIESIHPVIGKKGLLLFSGPEMKRWDIQIPDSLTSKGYQIKVIR
ncbi:ABC transporter substrate-binding protein [Desulfovibrio sp. JC010]|uniref:ABC transporter substrate-binding protein n=1 Tax=Desulfovibrio sp. JC010 TaxID=2593641 RepID=UPI0013D58D5C|nr:ABC transporter substrate binding protein [Desulfovibrio sp. JC010]